MFIKYVFDLFDIYYLIYCLDISISLFLYIYIYIYTYIYIYNILV